MAPSTRADRSKSARSVAQVVDELDVALRTGQAQQLVAIPTGFQPLDRVLRGGLHPGELVLIGGSPGVGKTILALQWARNMAAAGTAVAYACYEHEETDLLLRLLAMEMGEREAGDDRGTDRLHAALGLAAGAGRQGLAQVLEQEAQARQAFARVDRYAGRLWLLRASGAHTGAPELEQLLADHPGRPEVLFVDYLQKVAVLPEPRDEAEKVTRLAEGLKDLALKHRVPVVAVVASDLEGLRSARLRLHHFRGSSALAYEGDVAIVLNEKVRAVSKVHLAYDPVRAESFRGWVVLSVEKNRGGQNLVDLEHRKDFGHFRFDPSGGLVSEKLTDGEYGDH